MRRLPILAALVALATLPARAEDAPPPEQPAPPPAAAPAPAAPSGPTGATGATGRDPTNAIKNLPALMNKPNLPSNPEPPPDLKPELLPAFNVSVGFFEALVARDLDRMLGQIRAPFSFEGKTVNAPEEVRKRWGQALADLGRSTLTLYGVEVLPYEDMVKKYGKPPAKLADLNGKGVVVAVGNLDGRASLAFLRKDNMGVWRVVGYSD